MFCNKCGQSIADDSRFCKFCGAAQSLEPPIHAPSSASSEQTQPERNRTGLWIVGVLGGLLVLSALASVGSGPSSPASNGDSVNEDLQTDIATPTSNIAAPTAKKLEPNNWVYSTDVDKVRGGTSYFAETTSSNSISQDFPYDSATTMRMMLRKSPAYGTDVILTISSGQMMCPSYDGCSGTVRFDDGPASRIEFNGPADNSSDTVFVASPKSFISKLRKSNKVVIEKTLYQAGAPQFEFDVNGLEWEH